jgi:hypothetical protein
MLAVRPLDGRGNVPVNQPLSPAFRNREHETGLGCTARQGWGRHMDPISAVALSLALGAGSIAGKEVVSALVKDAYDGLKSLIKRRYPKVSLESLEQVPDSRNRRAVIEEDLAASGAAQDSELLAAAQKLIELIRQHAPNAAATTGVDLKDIEAANLRLADIVASGTGVKVEKARLSGDVTISGVRAGLSQAKDG